MRKNVRVVEDEDSDPREYTATEVCTVVNCEPGTLRAWRRRNGLFPQSMLSGGWNYFSLADMATVKLVVDLTAAGYTAQAAVDIAMAMLPIIEERGSVVPAKPDGMTLDQWINLNWGNYIVQVDGKGKISFLKFDASIDLAKLFEEIGASGMFVINMSNLMDLGEGLEILSGMRPPRKKAKAKKVAKVKRTTAPKRAKR